MIKIYNITCGTDDKYVQHCMAMLCSLFENNKDKLFSVHILTNNLSNSYQNELTQLALRYNNRIKFYMVDETPLDGVQFRTNRPLTKAAYYRLLLPSILPDIHTILYLDCDMIVLGDVDELFDIDLTGYALAACNDSMPYNNIHRRQLNLPVGTRTFCSGIMYINLDYWREHDSQNKCLNFAKRERKPVFLHDQDVFNYVFRDQWFLLPPKWNVSPHMKNWIQDVYRPFDYVEMFQSPCVYHYFDSLKPWQEQPCLKKSLYREYLVLSGFSSPRFESKTLKDKIHACNKILYIKYCQIVRPYMPKFIRIIIDDIKCIFELVKLLINSIINPNRNKSKEITYFKVLHQR